MHDLTRDRSRLKDLLRKRVKRDCTSTSAEEARTAALMRQYTTITSDGPPPRRPGKRGLGSAVPRAYVRPGGKRRAAAKATAQTDEHPRRPACSVTGRWLLSRRVRPLGAVLVAIAVIVVAIPALAPAVTLVWQHHLAPAVAPVWQNPQLAPNPFSNIHNDSFLSDNYAALGPRSTRAPSVRQINRVAFVDPATGQRKRLILGECAGITFDPFGNLVSVCAGTVKRRPEGGLTLTRHIIAFDRHGVVKAYTSFTDVAKNLDELTNFSPGYFYLENKFRPVVALPDGRVQVLQRVHSPLSRVDASVPVRSVQVTGQGGAVPIPNLKLYGLMPAPDGTIWFTTSQAVVGTIAPDDSVKWLDLNDLGGHRKTGNAAEQIANSHAVDRSGDAYVVTTHRLYRLSYRNGHVHVVWQAKYPRGPRQKPGQQDGQRRELARVDAKAP